VGPQTWGALRGAAKPVTSSAATSPASSTAATGMLQEGSHGQAVKDLQAALKKAGFDPHGVDGNFGPKTTAAVVAFQRSAGIVVDGRVGPQTWAALNARLASTSTAPSSAPTLKQGAKGALVEKLQLRLVRHGFKPGPVDGDFGTQTRTAVVAFQKAKGLPATGVVDASTWSKLEAAPTATTPTATGGDRAAAMQKMIGWAKSMVGCPYAAVNPFRFGDVLWDGKPHQSVNGSGTVWNYPKGTRVFDCSGFAIAAYRQLGVDLTQYGIYSTSGMRSDTRILQTVPRDQVAPGDLVLYQPKNGIGHVVIYLGNGKCVESAGGAGVCVRDVDWSRVAMCRRVPLS